MAIIRDQVEFLHVLEDTSGITSDHLGEKFEHELSTKMVRRFKEIFFEVFFCA
jgi:hypothetical protein